MDISYFSYLSLAPQQSIPRPSPWTKWINVIMAMSRPRSRPPIFPTTSIWHYVSQLVSATFNAKIRIATTCNEPIKPLRLMIPTLMALQRSPLLCRIHPLLDLCEKIILTTSSRVISNLNKFLGGWYQDLDKC